MLTKTCQSKHVRVVQHTVFIIIYESFNWTTFGWYQSADINRKIEFDYHHLTTYHLYGKPYFCIPQVNLKYLGRSIESGAEQFLRICMLLSAL
jgi:hypothetical protein